MPTPISTITSMTASGDAVNTSGAATYLTNGLPVSCLGDSVSGPACTGVISTTTCPTHLVKGRPMATVTSTVTGVNPATGVPASTTIIQSVDTTILD